MTLIVVTIVAIASVTTALAIPLFMIGTVLDRTAGNLSDSVQSVRSIAGQAQAIGPGVTRINQAGGELVGAMPLLLEDAEAVAAKMAPAMSDPTTSSPTTGSSVGRLDVVPATGLGIWMFN